MHVIGISGAIGHGKSTFSQFLADTINNSRIFEASGDIVLVANNWLRFMPESFKTNPPGSELLNDWIDSLAEIVAKEGLGKPKAKKLYVTEYQLETRDDSILKLLEYLENIRAGTISPNDIIGAHNKEVHRSILQWIGGYLVKNYHEGIWFDSIDRKLNSAKEDGAGLAIVSGLRFPYDKKIIEKHQGTIIRIERPHVMVTDSQEVTEKEGTDLKASSIIINDANLDELRDTAKTFFDDLSGGRILEKYVSSDFAT